MLQLTVSLLSHGNRTKTLRWSIYIDVSAVIVYLKCKTRVKG